MGFSGVIPETLTLYHNTSLGKLNSIWDKGLIPGGSENTAQDWEAFYHNRGVYLVPAIEIVPAQRFSTTKQEVELLVEDELIDAVEIVLSLELPTDISKLVSDEESVDPQDVEEYSGIKEYLFGDSVVWLGKIDTSHIRQVYIPDIFAIREYVESMIHINKDLISYILLK